jgi:excisionase family DNA binding protein
MLPAEVAPILRCSIDYVWQLCRDGKLPHIRKGNRILIRRQDVADYIAGELQGGGQG